MKKPLHASSVPNLETNKCAKKARKRKEFLQWQLKISDPKVFEKRWIELPNTQLLACRFEITNNCASISDQLPQKDGILPHETLLL